jgi:hypothetical protein
MIIYWKKLMSMQSAKTAADALSLEAAQTARKQIEDLSKELHDMKVRQVISFSYKKLPCKGSLGN